MYKFFEKKNVVLFCVLSLLLLTISETSYAQTALFDSGTNFLTALQNLLSSTWARLIAIIGVIALGFMAIMGRLRWGIAGAVIGGIILVFGAPAIVDSIAGVI